MAEVDCSGSSWSSSVRVMPISSALQQRQQLLLVGEVGAGGIAEGIAAAAIALRKHRVVVARLLGGEAQFAADALVDVFGEGLGHLDREAVQIEVILVAVVGEPFARRFRGAPAHRHDLQPDHVALDCR